MSRSKQDCLKDLSPEIYKKAHKVDNNTFRYIRDDGAEVIRLHNTDILIKLRDGTITLNSGSWQTVTTKDRMNKYLSGGWKIIQDKSIWYLGRSSNNYGYAWPEKNAWIPYADGIIIHPDGSIIRKGKDPKLKFELKKQIDEYANDFVNTLMKGNFPQPDSGDCWGCYFEAENNNHTMGTDHLLNHIQEKYYVPSLLIKAIKRFPVSIITQQCIGYYMGYHDYDISCFENIVKKQITKSIRKWMYLGLGIAH